MKRSKFVRFFNWTIRYKSPLGERKKWEVIDHQLVQSRLSLDMVFQMLEQLGENALSDNESKHIADCIESLTLTRETFKKGYEQYVKVRYG